MKKLKTPKSLFFFFCLVSLVQTNAQNNIDLSSFGDKKIVSVVETSSQSRKIGEDDKNSRTEMIINENVRKTLNQQEISIKQRDNYSLVNVQITKIKSETNINGTENNYDSDNPFERGEFATALGNQYDSFINKTLSLKCNKKGNIIDTVSKNINLKKVKSNAIPNLSENKLWANIFINSPNNFDWKIKNTWTDSLLVDGVSTVNQYEIQAIKTNIVTLKINGYSIPPKPSGTKYGTSQDGTSINLITEYEGIITVDTKNNFIVEINLNKRTESEIKIMNLSTKNLSEVKVNLKNLIIE